MNRQARQKKASEIRNAISIMRSQLKTATGRKKAYLTKDIKTAMDDYMTYMDDDMWSDDSDVDMDVYDDTYTDGTAFDDVDMDTEDDIYSNDLDMYEDTEVDDYTPSYDDLDMYEDAEVDDLSSDDVYDDNFYMDDDTCGMDDDTCGMDDMMGMDEDKRYSSVESENKQHVAYILNKIAQVMVHIEKQEAKARVASAGKPVRNMKARKLLSSYMKRLAYVVDINNMKKESTKKALDQVGIHVAAMHKKICK